MGIGARRRSARGHAVLLELVDDTQSPAVARTSWRPLPTACPDSVARIALLAYVVWCRVWIGGIGPIIGTSGRLHSRRMGMAGSKETLTDLTKARNFSAAEPQ
jgi:hypothetical protein